MSHIFLSARDLTKGDEGSYIRFDGLFHGLDKPANKSVCHRLHRVWGDGINIRRYGTPNFIRPRFISCGKFNQRVEVFASDEFEKLPE